MVFWQGTWAWHTPKRVHSARSPSVKFTDGLQRTRRDDLETNANRQGEFQSIAGQGEV
jgi:hypothetical protein